VQALASSVDNFVELPRGFLLSNRERVLSEQLDVLVYTDIGMDTRTAMWAHGRLAPIQVQDTRAFDTWRRLCRGSSTSLHLRFLHRQVATWGHPVTTGLPHMDYFVSSDLYEGEGEQRSDSLPLGDNGPRRSKHTYIHTYIHRYIHAKWWVDQRLCVCITQQAWTRRGVSRSSWCASTRWASTSRGQGRRIIRPPRPQQHQGRRHWPTGATAMA
jgi:hypothetical protein